MIFVAASRSLAFRSFIFAVGDLGELRAADRPRADLARLLRARLELGGLLQQEARRRGLGREREAAIGIDGDHRRDRHALFELLRGGVERLAEFHDVDAALAKRRADRRRRIGGAGRHLQLDIAGDFFSHDVSLCCGAAARKRFALLKFSGPSAHLRQGFGGLPHLSVITLPSETRKNKVDPGSSPG